MEQQEARQEPSERPSGDDIVRIRTDVPSSGDLSSLDDRSTRRLGRLPQHATAPLGPSDAEGRRGRMRRGRSGGGLGRIVATLAGTGLVAWGALTLAGVV